MVIYNVYAGVITAEFQWTKAEKRNKKVNCTLTYSFGDFFFQICENVFIYSHWSRRDCLRLPEEKELDLSASTGMSSLPRAAVWNAQCPLKVQFHHMLHFFLLAFTITALTRSPHAGSRQSRLKIPLWVSGSGATCWKATRQRSRPLLDQTCLDAATRHGSN